MKRNIQQLVAGMALTGLCMAGHAALHDRGNGMVYDDVQDITWLKDWNLSKTTGASNSGLMTWDQAVAWADGLTVGGYTDWRLPRMTRLGGPHCEGQPLTCGGELPPVRDTLDASELSHLWFVTLGAKPLVSPITGQVEPDGGLVPAAAAAMFNNLPVHIDYWLGTRYQNMTLWSWQFAGLGGDSYAANWTASNHAVAVRSGDILSAVPEPGSGLLISMGALALLWRVRGRITRPYPIQQVRSKG